MNRFALYGAGGFARELVAPFRARHPDADLVLVDDARHGAGEPLGVPVIGFGALADDPRPVCVAIADPDTRVRVVDRCAAAGLPFFTFVDVTAIVHPDVTIGAGSVVCAGAILTAGARLGRHVHVNLRAYVAHDSVVDDFATLGPHVGCNGHVHVEERAVLGAGVMVRNGRPGAPLVVGRGAVVGMGAVVVAAVPPGVTVVGNPARPIVRSRARA